MSGETLTLVFVEGDAEEPTCIFCHDHKPDELAEAVLKNGGTITLCSYHFPRFKRVAAPNPEDYPEIPA